VFTAGVAALTCLLFGMLPALRSSLVQPRAAMQAVGSGSTSADRKKQSDEFHSVVIFGERSGGRQWTALDVTDPVNPAFRWSWPPVGTTDSLAAGQSWNDHAPAPPPIGAVAVDDPLGPFTVAASSAKASGLHRRGGRGTTRISCGQAFHARRVDRTTGHTSRNRPDHRRTSGTPSGR
jgi:hypothetical protein